MDLSSTYEHISCNQAKTTGVYHGSETRSFGSSMSKTVCPSRIVNGSALHDELFPTTRLLKSDNLHLGTLW
jgi:hypothetical protein